MGNGSRDANSRVTVAILETKMGSMEDILNKEFKAAADRDEKISDNIAKQQGELNAMNVTLAVQQTTLKQVAKNEVAIEAMKTDVDGLKVVSKKWGRAGMGTSIMALVTAIVAGLKSEVLGQ